MKMAVLLAVCAATISLAAQVKIVDSPLPLDGKLTGNGWQDVPEQSGFSCLKRTGKTSPQAQTFFRIAADADNLYLSILCKENQMDKLRKDDGPSLLWTTDAVEVFLSPSGHPDDFYQFVVTAGKVRYSMYYEEAGVIKPDPYLPFWESKVFYGTDYWLVQLRIPFNAFYMTRNADWSTEWRLNLTRSRKPVPESSSWSPLQYSFQEPRNFRKFTGFPKRKPEQDLALRNVKPTITDLTDGVYSGLLSLTVEANPAAAGKYTLTVAEPEGKSSVHSVMLKSGINQIVLPKTEYLRKKAGLTELKLTLKSLKSGDVFERGYPVDIVYEPVRIALDSPGYKRNFYPGQDFSKIAGKLDLRLSSAQKKNAVVELTLSGDGLPLKTLKCNADEVIPFSFDSRSMKEGGKAVLSVKLLDRGREIASASQTITRLKKNSGSMLWIEDGVLYRNGKPCFFRTMSAWGYQGGRAIAERIEKDDLAFLRPCDLNLEPCRLVKGIESREATKDIKPCPELFEKIRQLVESNRNDPRLDLYYLCDEPEYRGISPVYLKYLYDFISELDPYHPVIVCSQVADRYFVCADILRGHPYYKPVVSEGKRTLHMSIQQVRDRIKNMTKDNRPDKLVGYTGQFFSCKYINLMADYPTWGELESSSWSALAQGARMFWPYAYHDLGDRPQIYEGVRYFNQSIQALESLLWSNRKHPVKTFDPENMIDTLLVEDDNATLLIVVNLKNGPVETTVSAEPLKKYASMYEFRGNGSREIVNGELKLSLKPYECVVLTSKKLDAGLKTRDQVVREIEAADRARASRGNLLFEKGASFEVDSSRPDPSGGLQQRNKLFDGTLDMLGWQSKTWSNDNWYELNFRKNPPRFSKIGIHGSNLGTPSVKIWKFGEWKDLTPKKTEKTKYSVLLDFGEELKSVKVRITFPGKVKKDPVELYEIELLK